MSLSKPLTEVEKIRHLQQKYQDSRRLYTVYERSGEEGRFVFTLIYGTDQKSKAVSYVHRKELEGLFLIVYCARPKERSSKCVYVSGLQNGLASPTLAPSPSPISSGSPSPPPSLVAPEVPLNGLTPPRTPSRVKVAPGASRGSKDGTHTTPASKDI